MGVEISIIYWVVIGMLACTSFFVIRRGRKIIKNKDRNVKGFFILVFGWLMCIFTMLMFMELPHILMFLFTKQ
jgi:hypothetical protein